MFVETARLFIRNLSLDDVELLYNYSREAIVKKELPDEVFDSRQKAKEAVENLISNYHRNNLPLVYGVIIKTDNLLIGHISLSKIDKGIEIGYSIAAKHQKKGYASEIINPFTSWAKMALKIEAFYGIAKKENTASWKALEKNGFILESEEINQNYFGGEYLTKVYKKW